MSLNPYPSGCVLHDSYEIFRAEQRDEAEILKRWREQVKSDPGLASPKRSLSENDGDKKPAARVVSTTKSLLSKRPAPPKSDSDSEPEILPTTSDATTSPPAGETPAQTRHLIQEDWDRSYRNFIRQGNDVEDRKSCLRFIRSFTIDQRKRRRCAWAPVQAVLYPLYNDLVSNLTTAELTWSLSKVPTDPRAFPSYNPKPLGGKRDVGKHA